MRKKLVYLTLALAALATAYFYVPSAEAKPGICKLVCCAGVCEICCRDCYC